MSTIDLPTDADNAYFVVRHRLTLAEYEELFDNLTEESYRLVCISGYTLDDEEYFAACFDKSDGPPQICRHGLSSAEYEEAFDDATAQDYRLVLINGYTGLDGSDKYVAIWDKSDSDVPPWVAKHGLTADQYQSEFSNWTQQGYRLKHLSGYAVDSSARYAAIFEETDDSTAWTARHGLTSAQYQAEVNTQTEQGYVPVLICGYAVDDIDYYAAIFEEKSSWAWIARHGMTSSTYQGQFENNSYQGYRLKVISGYTKNNVDLYAAIWENPNMNESDLSLINNPIQAYMNQHSIPGISIAITKQERLVFAKGFGYADTDTNEEVNPNHLFRIASVSKPMTSIAIMKLIEQDEFSLDSQVFGASSLLGTTYGTQPYDERVLDITVQHLLEHTSGFSNDGGDPLFMRYDLDQTELISWVLDNRTPKHIPGSTFEYLNFGYILLGRIIENVSGESYEDFLRNNIFNQATQPSRMVIGGDSVDEKNPDEVIYYPESVYDLHVGRMDANGGWIGRPIDLVGILTKLDQSDVDASILDDSTITTMWTGSSANSEYGKGWFVNASYKGHNGAMPGTIAFLVRRNDDLSYAFTVNTRPENDRFASQLKEVMDTIVTDVTAWPEYDLFQTTSK